MNESGEPLGPEQPEEPRREGVDPSDRPVSEGRSRGEQPHRGEEHTGEEQLSPEEQQRQREEAMNRLRENDPEAYAKMEEHRRLEESLTDDSLSAEEKAQNEERMHEIENDESIREAINNAAGREDFAEEQARTEPTEDGDIPPEEGEALGERIEGLNQQLREALGTPNEPDLTGLRREVGDIGDGEMMKKIRRSKGVVAKGLYYAWMTFLVLFGISAKAVQGVSRVATMGQGSR